MEHRVTIRLSPELYTQLEARGSPGLPLAAIVREALTHYLARQPDDTNVVPEQARALAAMAARLDTLERQVQGLTTQFAAFE